MKRQYKVGETATCSKTLSEYDVYQFAGITGDFNEVHINRQKAEQSVFKGRVAHGMLVASFVSAVLGMYLPGTGTIYLRQSLKFCRPVYIGDTITAKVTIREIQEEKSRALLDTVVENQCGDVVVEGEALVRLPE